MAHTDEETLTQWIRRKVIHTVGGSLAVVASMVLYALVDDPLKAQIGDGSFMALFAVYIVALIFGLNYFNKWLAH